MRRSFEAVLYASALCFGLVLVAPPTNAQGSEPNAEALLQTGYRHLMGGEPELALDLFQQSHRLDPTPRSLAQIGIAEGALERWADAELHLSQALAASDNPWVQERNAILQARLDEVRSNLGRLELSGGRPGSLLVIDGQERGPLPSEALWLAPGEHLVEVRSDELVPFSQTISIEAGTPQTLEITVREAETTGPEAETTGPETETTASETGTTLPTSAPEAPSGGAASSMWAPGWYIATGGVALLAVGAVLGGLALDHYGALETACRTPPVDQMECDSVIDQRQADMDTMMVAGDALIYGGLSVAVLGAILAFIVNESEPDSQDQAESPELTLMGGPTGMTLQLETSW